MWLKPNIQRMLLVVTEENTAFVKMSVRPIFNPFYQSQTEKVTLFGIALWDKGRNYFV